MESTIFFGNGINRLTPSNISWSALLDAIKGGKKFDDSGLPNTMTYERIILERPNRHANVLFDEFEVKAKISELMDSIEGNEFYEELFNMNAQHYLTTNYDYAFAKSAQKLEKVFRVDDFSSEDVYSIRRLKKFRNTDEYEKNFWQIHGEIKLPATIMLGLDHYCGSIGKIDSYIKVGYTYVNNGEKIIESSIAEKFSGNSFSNSSWVELFFKSNIHIISFSLDYTEIDLWWIITKRARMKKSEQLSTSIKNEIHFYCHDVEDSKKALLRHLDVIVHDVSLPDTKNKYIDYHKKLLTHIKRRL